MANLLTAIRLLLVVPVTWAFAQPLLLPPAWLMLLLCIAIATDYFDGKVARATGTESASGMLFDHGTDFVFVTSALTGIAVAGTVHPLLPVLISIAFAQYVLDSYFLFRQKKLRMSFLGRWNGILYFVPLLVFAASRLEIVDGLADTLRTVTGFMGVALIFSTIASIIDRAVAPLRGLAQK